MEREQGFIFAFLNLSWKFGTPSRVLCGPQASRDLDNACYFVLSKVTDFHNPSQSLQICENVHNKMLGRIIYTHSCFKITTICRP